MFPIVRAIGLVAFGLACWAGCGRDVPFELRSRRIGSQPTDASVSRDADRNDALADARVDAAQSDAGRADAGRDAGIDMGTCVTPTEGDTCSDAIGVPMRSGTFQLMGDTTCAVDNFSPSCSKLRGGRDVVYRLDLDAYRFVRVSTEGPPFVRNPFDTVLSMRRTCTGPVVEVACNDDVGADLRLSRVEGFVPPGSTFVVLDGAATQEGGVYSMRVDVDPQDTCRGAAVVDLPPRDQTIVVRGTTADAVDDAQAGCGGEASGPDHVYMLSVQSFARVRLEFIAPTAFDTVLHLRRACDDPSSEFACDDDGAPRSLSRLEASVEPGNYFVFVDGFGAAAGPYALAVTHVR